MSLLLLLQPAAAATIPTGPFFRYDADHPAANYATLTTTGGLVDQSGTAQPNLIPTSSAIRPTLNTGGANGHSFLTLDGVDDRLAGTGTLLAFGNNKPGLTVAVVCRIDTVAAAGASHYVVHVTIGGSSSTRIGILVDATGRWSLAGKRLDADATQTLAGSVSMGTGLHQLVGVHDYTNATQYLYLNGALIGEQTFPTSTAGNTSATNSNAIALGASATPNQWFPGDIYEAIGYDRALTATEVAQLWGYGQSAYALTPQTDFAGAAALFGSGTLTAAAGATGTGDVTATAGTPVEPTASVTTQVVALPAGLVDGDHTVLICSANGTTPVITPPAGWSALFPSTQSTASNSHAVAVYYRRWQAGDTDPTVTTTSARLSVLPVRVQGADPTTFLDTAVASTSPAAGATTVTAPAQTPATTGRLFVVASGRLGSSGTVLTWSPPPGMTEVGEADSRSTTQSNASGALFTEAVPVGADTGTRTATASSSSTGSRGISFVLKAAPVAAGGITTTGGGTLTGTGTLTGAGSGPQTGAGAATLAGAGTLSVAATGTDTGTTVRTYAANPGIIANPERGFFQYTETHYQTDTTGHTALDATALTTVRNTLGRALVFRYFVIERYRTLDTLDTAYLNLITADLAAIRGAGCKTILRFTYSTSGAISAAPYNADAPVARVVSHIQQLAPTLNAYADIIEAVQAGFIGMWGEWFYTDNFGDVGVLTTQNWADRQAVLGALLDNLDPTIYVLVRYPGVKARAFAL